MASLGIMATTFVRPTLDAVLDAAVSSGAHDLQFDLTCAGEPTLPTHIDAALCDQIRHAFTTRHLTMAALSGTFNMIHPDPRQRAAGLAGLRTVLTACGMLGVAIVTLCTGTRDAAHMWRRHPDNDTPEAWADLTACLSDAVRAAEEHGVTLAFEPEVANVVDSTRKARRLLDEIASPRLKVVMDPANIFHRGELPQMDRMLEDAFDLLGRDIALAHAKDLDHDGDAGHLPAGRGVLDYPRYLALLQHSGFTGAVVLHGLEESDVPSCVTFVRDAAPAGWWSDTAADG